MADRCENCTEKCPQAEMAHQVALGRMYVTKEFTALLKKVESGELVEVVRCKDCKHHKLPAVLTQKYGEPGTLTCHNWHSPCNKRNVKQDDFCSYGEKRDDNG